MWKIPFRSIKRRWNSLLFGNKRRNQCDQIYKTFTNIKEIACGYDHSVALKENKTIYCWDRMLIINMLKFIKHLKMLKK